MLPSRPITAESYCQEKFQESLKAFGVSEHVRLGVVPEHYAAVANNISRTISHTERRPAQEYDQETGNQQLVRSSKREYKQSSGLGAPAAFVKHVYTGLTTSLENDAAGKNAAEKDAEVRRLQNLPIEIGEVSDWKKRKKGHASSRLSVLRAGTQAEGGVAFVDGDGALNFRINKGELRARLEVDSLSCTVKKVYIAEEKDDGKAVNLTEGLCDHVQQLVGLGKGALSESAPKNASEACTQQGGMFEHTRQMCYCEDGNDVQSRESKSCLDKAMKTATQRFEEFVSAKGASVRPDGVQTAVKGCALVKGLLDRPLPSKVREKVYDGTGVSI